MRHETNALPCQLCRIGTIEVYRVGADEPWRFDRVTGCDCHYSPRDIELLEKDIHEFGGDD